jgi:hypothetical protein
VFVLIVYLYIYAKTYKMYHITNIPMDVSMVYDCPCRVWADRKSRVCKVPIKGMPSNFCYIIILNKITK